MDRYLLAGALGLLIFQVSFLLADLGLLGAYSFKEEQGSHQAAIGRLLKKQKDVKRKSLNSIIWKDPSVREQLYRFDSVLTLDHSGAEIELDGDIHLNIHENTLVVLEPLEESESNDLRIRFHQGMLRAQNSQRPLKLGSGDWIFSASEGSRLDLRSLDEGQLELEVESGSVHLANKLTGQKKNYVSGHKLTLSQDKVKNAETFDPSLKITSPESHRIYSHHFPAPVEVLWTGLADQLDILPPNRKRVSIGVVDKSRELLFLNPGNYVLNLRSQNKVSRSFTLELKPAPKIKYLHPLPRDRWDIGSLGLFSWIPEPEIKEYKVVFQNDEATTWSFRSPASYTEITPPLKGTHHWSIEALDTDGHKIPPFYRIPIHFTDKPLAAPKLLKPIPVRGPASPPKKSNPDEAFHEKLFRLLFPKAHAQQLTAKKEIVFSWYPVEGADFYIIEISEKPDFFKPVVIQKTKAEEFIWTQHESKNYYWRVAAGTNKGRMGVFSAPEKIEFQKLEVLTPEAFKPNKFEPQTQPQEPPAPVVIESTTPTAAPPTQATEATPQPLLAPPTHYRLQLHADYLSVEQESSDVDKATFKGLTTFSLNFAKSWWFMKKKWFTEFQLSLLSWKPKSESALPFQDDITNYFFKTRIHRQKDSSHQWGFSLMSLPVIKRQDLEAIDTESIWSAGVFYGFEGPLSATQSWHSHLELLYGDGLTFTQWSNEWRYQFHPDSESGPQLGVHLDLGLHSGRDKGFGTWNKLGFHWGWRW